MACFSNRVPPMVSAAAAITSRRRTVRETRRMGCLRRSVTSRFRPRGILIRCYESWLDRGDGENPLRSRLLRMTRAGAAVADARRPLFSGPLFNFDVEALDLL